MPDVALPTSAKTMSFVITRDRQKAKAFYGGILGFKLTGEDDFAIVYNMNGSVLRISGPMEFTPQPFTVLGWDVPDIAASILALTAQGVRFKIYDGFGQDHQGI